jgi:hypothetical protein
MKNMLKTLILAGIVLFAGTTLILSCSHDEGGLAGHSESGPKTYTSVAGGVQNPKSIKGYYGVTSDGKTIEVIIGSNSRSVRSVIGTIITHYEINVAGVVVSRGTVVNDDGNITFTPSDGSTVTPTVSNGEITAITIQSADGYSSYSGPTFESRDYFYGIGAGTDFTESQIENMIRGKTPKDVYDYCWTQASHFDDPESTAGTFAELTAFGQLYACPVTVIDGIADALDGNVSAVGWYNDGETNIMYYVSRIPFTGY